MRARDARAATLALLAARAPGATVCPSEVARSLVADNAEVGAEHWRSAMPAVHDAVDGLVMEGRVRLSWKGKSLKARMGLYRIAREERG